MLSVKGKGKQQWAQIEKKRLAYTYIFIPVI